MTWNGLELLQKCLPSVVNTDYDNLEIIISDNNSSDTSVEWIQNRYPQIRILRNPENYAFCRGNNEAIRIATGDYILLLNNDVEVPPDWLKPLVEHMDRNPDAAAVQPKLLQMSDRDSFEYSGAAGGFVDRFGYPFTRGRIFFTIEEDAGQYDGVEHVFWASGAAIMLRKSALDEVGLLDEGFILHMEEIDLCWRLQRAGYTVDFTSGSEVYHIGGASLPARNPRKLYYNFRNGLLLLYKNLPRKEWAYVFPVRFAFDTMAALRSLLSGRPGEVGAIFRAYRDAHLMKKYYRETRPGPDDMHVLPPYRGSIVVDYFLRRRRRFSDLPEGRFSTSVPEFQEPDRTTPR